MTMNETGIVFPDSTPELRTAEDEAADQQEFADNVAKKAYENWPNEAGFDGLTEERGPIELRVKGEIPTWAVGSLYRTGPGACKVENTPNGTHYVSHWFDGFAHSHKFDIVASPSPSSSSSSADKSRSPEVGGVRVFYTSRRQAENLMEEIKTRGHRTSTTFAQRRDPCIGFFGKIMSVFQKPTVDENVCVVVNSNVPGISLPHALPNGLSSSSLMNTQYDPDPSAPPAPSSSPSPGHRRPDGVQNIWLSTDANRMQQLNPSTLEPIGTARQTILHPSLAGPSSCAHAQRDPETGDFFNYNLDFGRVATYRVFRVNAATGTTDILATIADPEVKAAYLHSFFLTRNFVVLCVPVSHYALGGVSIPWTRNLLDSIQEFDEGSTCRWLVVDRKGGRGLVASFTSPAAFFFHSVNAFDDLLAAPQTAAAAAAGSSKDVGEEERNESESENENGTGSDGNVVNVYCEVIDYPDQAIMRNFYYDVLMNRDNAADRFWAEKKDRVKGVSPRLSRFRLTIPLENLREEGGKTEDGTGTRTQQQQKKKNRKKNVFHGEAVLVSRIPGPHAGELPTINPGYHTRRHRFCYGVTSRGRSTLADSIVKTDAETREVLIWRCPHGHTPGEAIFVPRPAGEGGDGEEMRTGEDDGVLLSAVLDGSARRSYLLCLDAERLVEVGRAEVPFAIGLGFHGVHAPSGNL